MNSPSKWPLACVAALAAGWLAGYLMGGNGARSGAQASPAHVLNGHEMPVSADSRAASEPSSETSAGHGEEAILRVLRETNGNRREHDLYEIIGRMSPDEIAAAIKIAGQQPSEKRRLLQRMLATRWAENDPKAAMEFAMNLEHDIQSATTDAVLQIWVAADRQAAMRWAQALPSGKARASALYGLVTTLAEREPALALQYLDTLPASSNTESSYYSVFSSWVAQDAAAAGAGVLALPRGANRENAIRATIDGWVQREPAAALAWAGQIPEQTARTEAFDIAYGRWAASDPQAASAAVLGMPPGDARNHALESILRKIGANDAGMVSNLIEQMPPGAGRDSAVNGLIARMTKGDPATAAQYLLTLPSGSARTKAVGNLASSWAREDAPATLAWLSQLPDDAAKKPLMRNAVEQLAERDPRAAVEYWLKAGLQDGLSDKGRNLAKLSWLWARQDPAAALAWARQIKDETVAGNVMSNVIGGIANTDPRQAADLVSQMSGSPQMNAATMVSELWARSDTRAAADWAMRLPNAEAQRAALGLVIQRWCEQDLVTVAGWLERLPAGPARDAAVTTYVSQAAGTDPESAASWAGTIADERQRSRALDRLAVLWLRQDKAAATRWITQNTAFDDETKQRLLRGN